MHPPVRWNFLSDGQPDNSTTLPSRIWSGGKNTGGLCSARSSIWALTEWQSLLCVLCLWRPWHCAETLDVHGGQRNLEIIQSKIQSSSGEDAGQEG